MIRNIGCRTRTLLVLMVLGTMVSSCVHYNRPVKQLDKSSGHRYSNSQAGHGEAGEIFFVLAFSGGGTRAAALSYGVLEELHRIQLPGSDRALLDEVDVLSSVSGGSFTAAYYALFKDEIFSGKFQDQVLKNNMERAIWQRLLRPDNLVRLPSPGFSRTNVAAEYYDSHIFDHRDFASLMAQTGDRPFLVLNSTVVSDGSRFEFTQDQFDLNCSDLGEIKIATGVAASAALPVVFKPLTVRNFAGRCDTKEEWIDLSLKNDLFVSRRRYAEATRRKSFSKDRPFLHLTDGGVSDNLGVRWLLDSFFLRESGRNFIDPKKIPAKKMVVLVVNARTPTRYSVDRTRKGPFFWQTASSAGFLTMGSYSFESLEYLSDLFDVLPYFYQHEGIPYSYQTYFIEVGIEAIAASRPKDYSRFSSIRTRLRLAPDQADWLTKLGGKLLRCNPKFQGLLQDLGQAVTCPTESGEAGR